MSDDDDHEADVLDRDVLLGDVDRFRRPDARGRTTMASLMPLMIGPMILSSVQIAATAIAPAPTNRTSVEKMLLTPSGSVCYRRATRRWSGWAAGCRTR